jgi:LuxR family transcriptional regulator, quorum-sensing system regulator CciR
VPHFKDIQAFVDDANRATTLFEMEGLLADAVAEIGFDHYSLVHHVDLATRRPEFVRLSNYPAGWVGRILEQKYYVDDPVHVACQRTSVGFRWSDVPKLVRLSDRQKSILAEARREGLGEGFTVPVHVPAEFTGSASFSVKDNRELPGEALPAAQYLGCFGFEAARRIARKTLEPQAPPPRLTPRQLDCLLLVARGKSDWDAAQLLGLSQDTVHQHVEGAKKRYGVASRTQLVVRALFDSQITFTDIL